MPLFGIWEKIILLGQNGGFARFGGNAKNPIIWKKHWKNDSFFVIRNFLRSNKIRRIWVVYQYQKSCIVIVFEQDGCVLRVKKRAVNRTANKGSREELRGYVWAQGENAEVRRLCRPPRRVVEHGVWANSYFSAEMTVYKKTGGAAWAVMGR